MDDRAPLWTFIGVAAPQIQQCGRRFESSQSLTTMGDCPAYFSITETAVVYKPAEEADDHGHGHRHH